MRSPQRHVVLIFLATSFQRGSTSKSPPTEIHPTFSENKHTILMNSYKYIKTSSFKSLSSLWSLNSLIPVSKVKLENKIPVACGRFNAAASRASASNVFRRKEEPTSSAETPAGRWLRPSQNQRPQRDAGALLAPPGSLNSALWYKRIAPVQSSSLASALLNASGVDGLARRRAVHRSGRSP